MKGFDNLKNTCYFNTSLQCLLQIPILSNHFLKNEYNGNCEFTDLYSKLVNIYWTTNNSVKVMNVSKLFKCFQKEFPRFKDFEENDIQECILCIIDILERSQPIVKDWFYGKKVQEVIWPGGKSRIEEPFGIHILTSNGNQLKTMLEDSFKWNIIENFEDKDNVIHHMATTRILFSELPKILIISFDKKSNLYISENIFLDKSEYKLIASGIHIGHQDEGHYVSFTKHKGQWYYKNDDIVIQKNLPDFAGHYVLIYNLKTL
jgi:ubiquitin C-terminal hydrolase